MLHASSSGKRVSPITALSFAGCLYTHAAAAGVGVVVGVTFVQAVAVAVAVIAVVAVGAFNDIIYVATWPLTPFTQCQATGYTFGVQCYRPL